LGSGTQITQLDERYCALCSEQIRHSGVVLGASRQAGTGEHSSGEVSQDVSQDPAIGFDGFAAAAANRDNLNSHEMTDPGCADPGHSVECSFMQRIC
jgi:hypothetical protein